MKETIETERQSTFIIAAKSFVGMVRDNNEDNFQVSSNLDMMPMSWTNNELCELSNRGALLVVADGMGGMNAGEVASEIAIETVKDVFTPQNITDEVVKTRYTIERFMNSTITEADNRIKQAAAENPATKGMGTTMVMGWIFDKSLYVSWAGDSRAYVFNPAKGLKRLSKDHSLVQELVDSGKISKEDAFDYPDSNVITNCLSAVSQKAVPESLAMPHTLEEGDVILLCSDGLCGLIRDTEIQSIITNNQDDMTICCDTLIQAACDAGGHDNVTVALCKIVSLKGGSASEEDSEATRDFGRKTWIKWGAALSVLAAVVFCIWWFILRNGEATNNDDNSTSITRDTTAQPQVPPAISTTDKKVVVDDGGNYSKTDSVVAFLDKGNLKIDIVYSEMNKVFIKIDDYQNNYGNYQIGIKRNPLPGDKNAKVDMCNVVGNKNTIEILSCTLVGDNFKFYFNDIEIRIKDKDAKTVQNQDNQESVVHSSQGIKREEPNKKTNVDSSNNKTDSIKKDTTIKIEKRHKEK
ncbi:MAG: serine/threonine-protein phosphatase [Bacteroidales bacterium]|nr:serine/threonine-protein phosphatase [Bacteroidales bacterium]